MGFWIFLFAMVMLVPILIISFGSYFKKKAPKEINDLFGYRTKMSMKNKQTWEFAHKYFGNIWFKSGWVMLILSVIAMMFTIGKSEDYISIFVLIIYAIQILFLFVSIFLTEKELKRNFDENGKAKK